MIQLFQESIPFSNKRLDAPASQGGSFLNPVIMPFAINATLGSNTFETVLYIRNTSIEHYYNDIVISLMKESATGTGTGLTSGILKTASNQVFLSMNSFQNILTTVAFPYSESQATTKVLDAKYQQNYIPITPSTDMNVDVKFSYGYDELSELDWQGLTSVLVIPMIGNKTTPDTSYVPIRMRFTINSSPTIFTIRDYFIDVSYVFEGDVI